MDLQRSHVPVTLLGSSSPTTTTISESVERLLHVYAGTVSVISCLVSVVSSGLVSFYVSIMLLRALFILFVLSLWLSRRGSLFVPSQSVREL